MRQCYILAKEGKNLKNDFEMFRTVRIYVFLKVFDQKIAITQ
jgi:hypothetical protein